MKKKFSVLTHSTHFVRSGRPDVNKLPVILSEACRVESISLIIICLFVYSIFASEEPRSSKKRKDLQNYEILNEGEKKYKNIDGSSSSSSQVPLKKKLSELVETNYSNNTIFPPDISQIIIDYAEPNKFFEIASMINVTPIFSLAWSPDSSKIASSALQPDVSIKIWNASNGKRLNMLMEKSDSCNWLNWKTNSKLLAISNNRGKIIYWDVNNNKHLSFNGLFVFVQNCSFSHISNQIAIIHNKSLNVGTLIGKQFNISNLINHNCSLSAVSWSNDGSKLAIADVMGSVFFIDSSSGEDLNITYDNVGTIDESHIHKINTIFWSHDDSKLVSVSDKKITVWDFETKSIYKQLDSNSNINCASLSPDGNFVAYSTNNKIQIWDIENNKLLLNSLDGFKGDISCIAWSPNGTKIAASSWRTIKIWGKTFA